VIDDIVARLRKEIRKRDREYPVELLPELSEAADEIERLRLLLADREAEITDLVLGFTHDVWWTPGHRDRIRCESYARSRGFTCFKEATDGRG
jgi:hypothetical protein